MRSALAVGASVKRLQVRQHRAMAAALAPLRISPVQWEALGHLRNHPEASQHDLARLTYQTDQSFGTLAARMLQRGLIERVAAPGRAVRHRLTAEGDAVLAEAEAVVEGVLARSFDSLTEGELASFDTLLVKILPPPPSIR